MSTEAEKPVEDTVRAVVDRYGREPASLISVLEDIQEELRYLPRQALEYVAGALGVARSRAYHVATFYKAFSLKPRGRHTFCVCRGTACHVQGADKVAELLRMKLGVSEGEMTEDGLFSVESVRCLGCCSLAPAVMVDGAVFGQINRNTLQDIIETYADEDEED